MPRQAGVAGVVETLQGIRRRCDECLRDRADPAATLVGLSPLFEAVSGDIRAMASFAPGLGDVWDTARAVMNLALVYVDEQQGRGGGASDAGIRTAIPPGTTMGEALSSDDAGFEHDPEPVTADD